MFRFGFFICKGETGGASSYCDHISCLLDRFRLPGNIGFFVGLLSSTGTWYSYLKSFGGHY